jgi:hypothetical protein
MHAWLEKHCKLKKAYERRPSWVKHAAYAAVSARGIRPLLSFRLCDSGRTAARKVSREI